MSTLGGPRDSAKEKSKVFRRTDGFCGLRVNAVGYILVGGASSRFGQDKALTELGGLPMYARMKGLLKALMLWRICLVGDPSKYGNLGIDCIADLWPGEGPLGGIVSALRKTEEAANADFNLIISCDMPFLTKEWLESLLTHAFRGEAQVVLARSDYGLEPLCAVWRTDARAAIEEQFQKGLRKVTEAIAKLKSEVLDETEWKRFDSAGRLFWNMNTQSDYEEAKKILEAEQRRVAWRYEYK